MSASGQKPSPLREALSTGSWRTFVAFTAFTYLFSWSLWVAMAAGVLPESLDGALIRIGGFGPFVGALGVLWLSDRSLQAWFTANVGLRVPLRWYGYALVIPPVLVGVGGLVHAAVLDGTLALDALPPLWAYPINLLIVFFVGGGQEELGWRAFALPEAQRHLSALTSSVLVGLVWAGWHLPLFLLPNAPQSTLPFVPYLVAVVGISVILTWLYNGSGGNVVVAMLFHGGLNPLAAYFPTGGTDAIATAAGYGSYALVVVVGATALVLFYGRTDLATRPRITLEDRLPTPRSRPQE